MTCSPNQKKRDRFYIMNCLQGAGDLQNPETTKKAIMTSFRNNKEMQREKTENEISEAQ